MNDRTNATTWFNPATCHSSCQQEVYVCVYVCMYRLGSLIVSSIHTSQYHLWLSIGLGFVSYITKYLFHVRFILNSVSISDSVCDYRARKQTRRDMFICLPFYLSSSPSLSLYLPRILNPPQISLIKSGALLRLATTYTKPPSSPNPPRCVAVCMFPSMTEERRQST